MSGILIDIYTPPWCAHGSDLATLVYHNLSPRYPGLMSSDIFQSPASSSDGRIPYSNEVHPVSPQANVRLILIKASKALAPHRAVLTLSQWANLEGDFEYKDGKPPYALRNFTGCPNTKVIGNLTRTNFVICEGNVSLYGTQARQDPHLTFAHGGVADFRGRDNALWNFLSAQGVSLNVRTRDATFRLRDTIVHGSFLVDAYILALTHNHRFANISFTSSRLNENNFAWDAAVMHCQSDRTVRKLLIGPFHGGYCDGVNVSMAYSSMTVDAGDWTIKVAPQPVYEHISGPRRRIDLSLHLNVPESTLVAPHGILGQAYDGDGLAVNGRQDTYPASGEFTTAAMAEGAIEGTADDYEMASPFEHDFRYARFGLKSAAPRDASRFKRVKTLSRSGTNVISAAE